MTQTELIASYLLSRLRVAVAGRYNQYVSRASTVSILALLLFVGCANGLKNKEKVQEAIVEHVRSKAGLDVNSLDINTTSLTFDKNMAFATIAFHPKGALAVNSGITMKYTLEERDGKWVVLKIGDSQGHGISGHPSPGSSSMTSELPPGHPSVSPPGSRSAEPPKTDSGLPQ